MVASVKTYAYTLTVANGIPQDTAITVDSGALTSVNIELVTPIADAATVVVFKRNRTITRILNSQVIDIATGVLLANHEFAVTADGMGIAVTAVAEIPDTAYIRLSFLMSN